MNFWLVVIFTCFQVWRCEPLCWEGTLREEGTPQAGTLLPSACGSWGCRRDCKGWIGPSQLDEPYTFLCLVSVQDIAMKRSKRANQSDTCSGSSVFVCFLWYSKPVKFVFLVCSKALCDSCWSKTILYLWLLLYIYKLFSSCTFLCSTTISTNERTQSPACNGLLAVRVISHTQPLIVMSSTTVTETWLTDKRAPSREKFQVQVWMERAPFLKRIKWILGSWVSLRSCVWSWKGLSKGETCW